MTIDNKTVNIKQAFLAQTLVKVNGVKTVRTTMQINNANNTFKALSIFTLRYLSVELIAHNS